MAERKLNSAEAKRRAMLAERGLALDESHRLHDALFASLDLEVLGFKQLAGLSDGRTRAGASDSILSAADAVETNLGEAATHADRYTAFVGPNGRTMPGPETTDDERQVGLDGEGDLVAFFRALGSMVDCFAAVTVGVLRLPASIEKAQGSALIRLDRYLANDRLSASQQASVQRVNDLIAARRAVPTGWLEWTLEMRNQLVHRGRQMSVWMPVPRRGLGAQLLVPTKTPPQYLVRFEPHLRRQPWLPEMEILGHQSDSDMWLAEPATATLQGLLGCGAKLANELSALLTEIWALPGDQTDDWHLPDEQWKPAQKPSARINEANQFQGFDAAYTVPPSSSIRVSERDAVRFQIAETLRRREEESSG